MGSVRLPLHILFLTTLRTAPHAQSPPCIADQMASPFPSLAQLHRYENKSNIHHTNLEKASSGSYASVYSIDGETVPYSVYSSTLEGI